MEKTCRRVRKLAGVNLCMYIIHTRARKLNTFQNHIHLKTLHIVRNRHIRITTCTQAAYTVRNICMLTRNLYVSEHYISHPSAVVDSSGAWCVLH